MKKIDFFAAADKADKQTGTAKGLSPACGQSGRLMLFLWKPIEKTICSNFLARSYALLQGNFVQNEFAEAAGGLAIGGIGMLLWQGVVAFKLFTGREMPAQEVLEKFFS